MHQVPDMEVGPRHILGNHRIAQIAQGLDKGGGDRRSGWRLRRNEIEEQAERKLRFDHPEFAQPENE